MDRHMHLRRTFVAVHVRAGEQTPLPFKTVVDGHKHFVEGGGWSEHAVFTQWLQSNGRQDALPVPSGQGSGGPPKKRIRNPKAKRSTALKKMLRAPDGSGRGTHSDVESDEHSGSESAGDAHGVATSWCIAMTECAWPAPVPASVVRSVEWARTIAPAMAKWSMGPRGGRHCLQRSRCGLGMPNGGGNQPWRGPGCKKRWTLRRPFGGTSGSRPA